MRFLIKATYFGKVHEHKIEGESERHAINKLYGILGSKNGLKRSMIKIEEVKLDGSESK